MLEEFDYTTLALSEAQTYRQFDVDDEEQEQHVLREHVRWNDESPNASDDNWALRHGMA